MTTKERAELRRHLAEQRPDKNLGCTDAFWLKAADLIVILDQADALTRERVAAAVGKLFNQDGRPMRPVFYEDSMIDDLCRLLGVEDNGNVQNR